MMKNSAVDRRGLRLEGLAINCPLNISRIFRMNHSAQAERWIVGLTLVKHDRVLAFVFHQRIRIQTNYSDCEWRHSSVDKLTKYSYWTRAVGAPASHSASPWTHVISRRQNTPRNADIPLFLSLAVWCPMYLGPERFCLLGCDAI
jgi:hypothetical protein